MIKSNKSNKIKLCRVLSLSVLILLALLPSIAIADSLPPASISNLNNKTITTSSVNWTWKDPVDVDFAKVMIYLDGKFKKNVTKGYQYYKATSLLPNTIHTISIHTVDTSGNINMTWVNFTSLTKKDTTYPKSITGLKNITYESNYINWIWNDSTSSDFAYVMIYINGEFVNNVSKGIKNYNATNLDTNTDYTISTRSVDTSGNINKTWINKTSRTATSIYNIPTQTITELHNNSYDPYYINWTWIDPEDLNYTTINIYIDGVFIENLGRNIEYYNISFDPDSNHEISTQTVDINGNINPIWVNNTANTAPLADNVDKIPPQSINNLKNISYASTYINWTWNDPVDVDFAKVMVYIDGVFVNNVTKGIKNYNSTFAPNTRHEISTHTVDTNGNINLTWVNDSESTFSEFSENNILRFITVGDPHIGYSKTNTTKSLIQVVNFANNQSVDFVILLGDITDHSYDSEFLTVKDVMSKLNKPYYVVKGNHDVLQGMTKLDSYFGPAERIVNAKGYQLLFIDMNDTTASHWKFNFSKADKSLPTMVFMHSTIKHSPPGFCCTWGNNSINTELDKFSHLISTYSGHVHSDTNQIYSTPLVAGVRYTTKNGMTYTSPGGTCVVTPTDTVGYSEIQNGVLNYSMVNFR